MGRGIGRGTEEQREIRRKREGRERDVVRDRERDGVKRR